LANWGVNSTNPQPLSSSVHRDFAASCPTGNQITHNSIADIFFHGIAKRACSESRMKSAPY
jgi:hypothetical protein